MEAQRMWWRRLNLGRSKLKASARASALLSGFAMVALVEIQLNTDDEVPAGLLVAFVICTTLLIAVHMLSLMIATCILPHIESVSIIPGTTEYSANDGTHDRLRNYIEMSWFFSTTIGIFLFLVEICLICWVKFWRYGSKSGSNVGKIASISVTLALIPIFMLFIMFAVTFYRNLVTHQFEKSEREILELDTLINQLNLQGADRCGSHLQSGDRRGSDLSAMVAAAVLNMPMIVTTTPQPPSSSDQKDQPSPDRSAQNSSSPTR